MNNTQQSPVPSDRELERIETERQSTMSLMKDLDSKFNDLPEGEPDPKSSDIEDLYARKEESILKLKNQLKALLSYKKTMNELVQKYSQRLGILNKDKKVLSSKKAKEKYTFAGFIQENKYQKIISCQKELDRVIESAKKAIIMANTKKFPRENPQKKLQALLPAASFQPRPDITPSSVIPAIPANPSVSYPITNQVNGLLSLGPLGK